MKRLLLMIPMLLMVGCAATPSTETGKTAGHIESIQSLALNGKKNAASPADAQAFDEIYNESVMAKTADDATQEVIVNLKKQLASAKDTAKLRDSLVWLVPGFLIASVLAFAAWGYFKIRFLEYLALAFGAISLSAIVLYLAIQEVQRVFVWAVPVAVIAAMGYGVYLFIVNRKRVTAELEAGTAKAIAAVPAEAQAGVVAAIQQIQSPQTQALVAQAQAIAYP